jgi:hypothetical protein
VKSVTCFDVDLELLIACKVIQIVVMIPAEACGQVLAELGKTRAPPPERTRTISLPNDGPSIRIRELADFEGDNHGAQVVRCCGRPPWLWGVRVSSCLTIV